MVKQKSWHGFYENYKGRPSNIWLHWPYLNRIKKFKPKSILEIGCGPADHAMYIKRKKPSTKIFLLDQDTKLLKKVEQK